MEIIRSISKTLIAASILLATSPQHTLCAMAGHARIQRLGLPTDWSQRISTCIDNFFFPTGIQIDIGIDLSAIMATSANFALHPEVVTIATCIEQFKEIGLNDQEALTLMNNLRNTLAEEIAGEDRFDFYLESST